MAWISFITIAEVWHSMNTCQFVLSVFVPFFIHLARIYWVSDICQGIQKGTESTKMNQSQFLFSRFSASAGCGGGSRVNRQLEKNMAGTELNKVGAVLLQDPQGGVVFMKNQGGLYRGHDFQAGHWRLREVWQTEGTTHGRWHMLRICHHQKGCFKKLWLVSDCMSNLWLGGCMGPRVPMNI